MTAAARALLTVLAILGCAPAVPFAAASTFADDSTAAATANLPCP